MTLRVQREFAKNNNCIIEGRGIGIDVLPNADLKLFLTARPEVRAMRENGKKLPNYNALRILADFFVVPMDVLFDR